MLDRIANGPMTVQRKTGEFIDLIRKSFYAINNRTVKKHACAMTKSFLVARYNFLNDSDMCLLRC